MGWQEEVEQIITEEDTRNLAGILIAGSRQIPPPSREDEESLNKILDDVSRELPQHRAMWVAFWLGASWYKRCMQKGVI